jgi:hypothetical protein
MKIRARQRTTNVLQGFGERKKGVSDVEMIGDIDRFQDLGCNPFIE